MRLSFKVDFLQRKRTLFSLLTLLWHITNNDLSFHSNICVFLTKAFQEIHTFQRTWLSFKVILLQGKETLFSLLTIPSYIANNVFTFLRNTCAFLTKAFLDILTFQKNVIIFQIRVSTEKDNTVLTYNNTLTYCQQWRIFSE